MRKSLARFQANIDRRKETLLVDPGSVIAVSGRSESMVGKTSHSTTLYLSSGEKFLLDISLGEALDILDLSLPDRHN